MAELTPALSVVVPTLDEEDTLPQLLADLRHLIVTHEILVVDGGSRDGTRRVARAGGATVLKAPRGRASQMNAGACAARAPWLCFLHADVRVPAAAREALAATMHDPGDARAAVWRLAIDAPGIWARIIETGASLRERLFGLPYGDQGLLVQRTLFQSVGGFPAYPIMEDAAMARILSRHSRLLRLPAPIVTSARRWRRAGRARTLVRNVVIGLAFGLGVSPHRLARWRVSDPS